MAPYQVFVRNFVSLQSPYNSILLYHGLGTGKTCSAISIAEEMREYNNQINSKSKIIIVASPNVQENFKLQLFNENKLINNKGIWESEGCVGNKLIKEVNPTNNTNIDITKITKNVNKLIKENYSFYGYTKFANLIKQVMGEGDDDEIKTTKLQNYFDNGLVIIDEAHNIRTTLLDGGKTAVDMVNELVTRTKSMRLCLLSGTPMYNDNTEIIWLLNLLNKNDNRDTINKDRVFDKNGEFKVDDKGIEIGKEYLIKHMRGYVSFVRGDNPFTFPYKIYPSQFAASKNILSPKNYPKITLNSKNITKGINHIELYVNEIGSYQSIGYQAIVESIKIKLEKMGAVTDFDDLDNFNYTILEEMILGLNVIYPLQDLQRGGAISENDFREYIKNEKVIQFYSSAKEPYYNLSNLSIIREGIDYNGIKYPSTEHAYQAQKFIESDRKRFSLDGDLGNLSGFALVGANEQQWMKKYNIGIIAKMASSDKNIKKLKLTKDPAFDVNKNYDIWIKILREKYKLEWFKEILIGTGNAYLLEFSKGLKKMQKKVVLHFILV